LYQNALKAPDFQLLKRLNLKAQDFPLRLKIAGLVADPQKKKSGGADQTSKMWRVIRDWGSYLLPFWGFK